MSKYKIGDRVEIRISGDVTNVYGQHDDYLQLDTDVRLWTKTEGLNIRKVARRRPPVGTTISAEDLRRTWWQRGTVIRHEIRDWAGDGAWRYMLLATGKWMEDSGEIVDFQNFQDANGGTIQLVYLP